MTIHRVTLPTTALLRLIKPGVIHRGATGTSISAYDQDFAI
jgi:hypothetical protein